jgi:hypothetical protein
MPPSFVPAKQKGSYKINYKTIKKAFPKIRKVKKKMESSTMNLNKKNKKKTQVLTTHNVESS